MGGLARSRERPSVRGSPCIFLVPLMDNLGEEFPPETFIRIKQALDRQFGGYTILGVVEGSWHGQVEPSLRIQVVVTPDKVNTLRDLVIAIGRELGQKAMYFEQPPPSAEIISLEDE
jgi:hypothetical protein